jgi:hypothetical protein
MAGSQLKRAEKTIAAIRNRGELSPETAQALAEIIGAIRTIEGRLADLEGRGRAKHTAAMELPNRG